MFNKNSKTKDTLKQEDNNSPLLFDIFNTKKSYVSDICYDHLTDAKCDCEKKPLGRVRELTHFFDTLNLSNCKSNKKVIQLKEVPVSKMVCFFEELKIKELN